MNRVVILAAGKGTRMGGDVPKVLVPVKNKPMISWLIESVIRSEVDSRPIIIVSSENKEKIKNCLKKFDLEFIIQKEQLGTGHALLCAKNSIDDKTERVIVLNGDHPFVADKTIQILAKQANGDINMATVLLEDFCGWRNNFYHWGRIVRRGKELEAIIEFKDANNGIREKREVNPGMYGFNNQWLWINLEKIGNNNAQKEFYLTDLVGLAFKEGKKINSFVIDAKEAIGINSREELKIAEEIT